LSKGLKRDRRTQRLSHFQLILLTRARLEKRLFPFLDELDFTYGKNTICKKNKKIKQIKKQKK